MLFAKPLRNDFITECWVGSQLRHCSAVLEVRAMFIRLELYRGYAQRTLKI